MTWFKVDDSFHSHPKALAASPAALGLWVVAGSWCGSNLSDGFVPDHVLPRLLADGAALAKELASTGLWKRARGGYRFHDWGDFNPQREVIEEDRKAARERMRAIRAGRKEAGTSDQRGDFEQSLMEGRGNDEKRSSGGNGPAQAGNGSAEQQANVRQLFVTPTRPVKNLGGALGDPLTTARTQPPSPLCSEHQEAPVDGPCGRCADARRARERWDLADSNRRRNAEKCRSHRGQPADNCALCRSEDLAAEEDS